MYNIIPTFKSPRKIQANREQKHSKRPEWLLYEKMSSINKRHGAIPMNSQQYDCLSQLSTVTKPHDKPKWMWKISQGLTPT